MHIAIWIIAALLLGLWTLLAWGVATVLGLDPSWVGDLKPLVEQVPFAAWLDTWVPGWEAMTLALLELTRSLLAWAGGAGVVIVWVLWGLGAAALVGCAALLSVLVAVVRRTTHTPQARPA
jgi:hypothetical protein